MTLPQDIEGFKVTQADREAAADLRLAYSAKSEEVCASARMMRSGQFDSHSFVQTLARHRHDSTRDLLEALRLLLNDYISVCEEQGLDLIGSDKDPEVIRARAAISRALGKDQ